MSSYDTEYCKNFLVEKYPSTVKSKWKRERKYKDAAGLWCRDFSYGCAMTITLQETPAGLVEKPNPTAQAANTIPCSQGISSAPVVSTGGMHQILFGGGQTSTSGQLTAEDKFLHVIRHGIDWEAPQGQRSAFDFAQHIDFNQFTKKCESQGIHLGNEFMVHVCNSLMLIYELDETYMPDHIATPCFDDSYPDLMHVMKQIEQGYAKNQLVMEVHKATLKEIINIVNDTRNMADYDRNDCDPEEGEKIMDKMHAMFNKYLKAKPSKGL